MELGKDPRSKFDQQVLGLVAERYPASYAWWTDNAPRAKWVPWNQQTFARDADRWREIARLSQGQAGRAKVFGDHARRALVSITHFESWRFPHAALGHVRKTLETFLVLEAITKSELNWSDWLGGLSTWFKQLLEEKLEGGDPWVAGEVLSEGRRLEERLQLIGQAHPAHLTITAEIQKWVQQIPKALLGPWQEVMEPASWAAPANLDGDEWARKREQFGRVIPKETGPTPEVLGLQDLFPSRRTVEVLLLDQLSGNAWMRPDSKTIQVAVGQHAEYAGLVTDLRIWWWEQSPSMDGLAWALADPMYVEAVILAVWSGLSANPKGPADQGRKNILARLRQQALVSAIADAWLWLNDGDVDEVAAWLLPFFGEKGARWLIWRMRLYPGYWLERERLCERVEREMRPLESLQAWEGWNRGPLPPD